MIDNLPPRPFNGPIITIDPGSAGTGLALFLNGENKPHLTNVVLSDWRDLPGIKWIYNCQSILDKLNIHLETYRSELARHYGNAFRSGRGFSVNNNTDIPDRIMEPLRVFIEEPQYFDDFSVGKTAAKSGSLCKLVYFYGRLWEMIRGIMRPEFNNIFAVPIPLYKGQLSKQQMRERVKVTIQQDYKSHDCDAVFMGLWLRGLIGK